MGAAPTSPFTDAGREVVIVEAVRTLQIVRLTIEVRAVTTAAEVMREVEAAVRERLGTRSLKDLIAAK